ncbi:MAG: elongation factor 1-beta [Candidatus Thermoplasmatota archaeon]|nr:elongation factor 1-beta [Candidatus Thermoplasmatota archaeon]MCL5730591.1 elongation factor 1-beta [Candidatus Thermoplasmatota archaeon]
MGEVLASLRILPEDTEVNTEDLSRKIEESIGKECTINRMTTEEIGFGLKALILEVIVPDEEGRISSIENKLMSISGISQVDTQNVSLI